MKRIQIKTIHSFQPTPNLTKRFRHRIKIQILAFLFVTSGFSSVMAFSENSDVICTVPEGVNFFTESVVADSKSQSIAMVLKNRLGMLVMHDQLAGKVYDLIGKNTLKFNPVRPEISYMGFAAGKSYVVRRGKEGEVYDGAADLVYSPDGNKLAYHAQSGSNHYVVVNENRGPSFMTIANDEPILFSPDSKKVAYKGLLMKKWHVVLDDKTIDQTDGAKELIFSPDSSKLAFAARDEKKWYVVLDDWKSKKYTNVFRLTFSRDSKHFAFAAQDSSDFFIIADQKPLEVFDLVGTPIFSPADSELVYSACKKGKWFIIKGKEKGPELNDIGPYFFTENAEHFVYSGEKDGKYYVFIDGKQSEAYEKVSLPEPSPDGKRIMYFAQKEKDGKWFAVIDGKQEQEYDMLSFALFSPDSKKAVYIAQKGKKFAVVENGKESQWYDGAGYPVFSSDSSHLAYEASKDNKWFMVVDREESKSRVNNFIKSIPPHFDGNKLNVIGLNRSKDNEFVLIEIQL